MELKYKLGMLFWEVFPWLIIGLMVLFLLCFVFSIGYVISYIDKHGLKSIIERIWIGGKLNG